MPIPYGRQTIEARDVEAVLAVLEGDWLTQGPAVEAFERAVAEACDAPHAVAFSSGTAGLHAAAAAAGLGAGDELVTSAITFAASANCGVYVGAEPRFADIDPATWNLTAQSVAAVLTERTRAVVPVHFAGLPAPVREVREAVGDDVVVIEDAAHAIGARDADGVPVGACRHSDMAVFSFHPVKTVTTAEGGVVTTRSDELAARLRGFRTHGLTGTPLGDDRDGGWYRGMESLGFNYRLSDVHAALGTAQMTRLDAFVDRRNAIAARYRKALDGLPLALQAEPAAPARHGRHLVPVRLDGGAPARRALYDHLRAHDVLAQVHYLPVHRHPFYEARGWRAGDVPQAEGYYAGCLSLPCFPTLTDGEQDRVVALVREALG